MLDHKGKTGCIDVIFNGIDPNNLLLKNILLKNNQIPVTANTNTSTTGTVATTTTASATTANINTNNNNYYNSQSLRSPTRSLNILNESQMSSTLIPTYSLTNISANEHERGAVGGEAASAVASGAGFLTNTSLNNETTNGSDRPAAEPNVNTIQELSLGLPQG